jgi:superfamily II DNA/RNA helicase
MTFKGFKLDEFTLKARSEKGGYVSTSIPSLKKSAIPGTIQVLNTQISDNQTTTNSSFITSGAVADSMPDQGLASGIAPIQKKISVVRQNMFFSATMPEGIVNLICMIMNDPIKITVAEKITGARNKQSVYYVSYEELPAIKNTYPHHIGRTTTAGPSRKGLRLCKYGKSGQLENINRVLFKNLQVIPHQFI